MKLPLASLLFAHAAMAKSIETPAAVVQALAVSAEASGVRAEIVDYRTSVAPDCMLKQVELPSAVAVSGRLVLKVAGESPIKHCEGTAWVDVRAYARVAVAMRALNAGDSLDGAVELIEQEVPRSKHPLREIPSGMAAVHPVRAGVVVDISDVRQERPQLGASIQVVIRSGGLSIEQTGRIASCDRDQVCAVLPTGKRIAGKIVAGHLEVTLQ